MIRTAGVYLLFGAVALRALVVFADNPQLGLVLSLLAVYGLTFIAGPRLIRRQASGRSASTTTEKSHPGSRATLPHAYLLLQSALVAALLFIPATEDFFGNLFILLGMDAVYLFGWRKGSPMIVLFSVIIAVALASSPQGPLFGSAMASLYGGVGFLLGGYANQVQKAETARQNTERLLVDLQSAHRQLQGYVSLAEEMAAEQERSRLAHELHDCVTQTVFSMNLTVQSTRLLLDRDPGRAEEQLVRLEELATGALREIRTLVYHLQPANGARGDPSAFASHDLPEALHRLASERQSQDRLRVSVEVNGSRSLTSRVSAGLTAIAREALINVARHAGTGEASIRLDLAHRGAYLEIEDHGSGFDPAVGFAVSGHFGLAGMADRAKEIDWDLFVDTGPGLGTRIRVAERQSGAQGERFDKP